ncbi:MAG: glycosyltransferase family 4 protein, partial [Candidatus Falkowbacteria bacterium]
GVDLEKFNNSVIPNEKNVILTPQMRGKNLKETLGIKENEKVIITVSRLVEKNGVSDLIDAINLFIIHHSSFIKLLVLGDGPLKIDLKLKIENLKLSNNILLLGSVLPESVVDYLSISDVFIRPSLSEGLGNVFLEAMAAGVPIMGTKIGGIPDFLIDGETGLFCEVQNPKSIANKIELLLSNETLRQKLILNGKKLVAEKYNWNIIAKQMESIFEKLKI